MKLKHLLALLSLVCFFGLISCKSTPEPEPEPEPQPVVEEQVPEEKTEEAPKEEKVEEPVQEEQKAPEKSAEEIAAENAALLAMVEEARSEAIQEKADSYFTEVYNKSENSYSELKKAVDDKSSEDYSQQLKTLAAKYKAMALAAKAKSLKEKIDELNLSAYDQASYDEGSKTLEEFDALPDSAEPEAMMEKAKFAFASFTTVFTKAFKALAAKERKEALAAKKNADSVKAGVSQKETYKKAADTFKKADSEFVTLNIEAAYNGYKSAKEILIQLYEKVSEARKAALEAINRAKAVVEESEAYAKDADEISPLGEGEVQGIEAEDAKLLEDDDFTEAQNSEINIEEGETAQAAEKASEATDDVIEGTENTASQISEQLKTTAGEAE